MKRAASALAVLVAVSLAGCDDQAVASADGDNRAEILLAQDGPLVTGLSYCYAALSGREDRDTAAQRRGLVVPKNEYGRVGVLDGPREGGRRAFRRTYTGPAAGTDMYPSGDQDMYVTVRLTPHDCETLITGVPERYEDQLVDITQSILTQIDPRMTPDPYDPPFRRTLVAGVGPDWHGSLWFGDFEYWARVGFRKNRYGAAVWKTEINHSRQ